MTIYLNMFSGSSFVKEEHWFKILFISYMMMYKVGYICAQDITRFDLHIWFVFIHAICVLIFNVII